MHTRRAGPTLRDATIDLPMPVAGQPFDLLATLRRCTGMLTFAQAAKLVGCDRATIKRRVDAGKIPSMDVGLADRRINPYDWAAQIELQFTNKNIITLRRAQVRRAA